MAGFPAPLPMWFWTGLKGSKPNHTMIGTIVFCTLTQRAPAVWQWTMTSMTIALQNTVILTPVTGISDPELVFDSHSSPPVMSELVPTYENSMDSIPADKVLKMTQLDLQKRFPIYHVCPNAWRPFSPAWHSYRTAWHSFRNWMRWERHWLTGNVGICTADWFNILKISRINHTIYFIL